MSPMPRRRRQSTTIHPSPRPRDRAIFRRYRPRQEPVRGFHDLLRRHRVMRWRHQVCAAL
jgi:hypothetical protein